MHQAAQGHISLQLVQNAEAAEAAEAVISPLAHHHACMQAFCCTCHPLD